jgi:GTPase SAR1 family protein
MGLLKIKNMDTTSSSKKPLCLIVMGMAGSGKTTFVEVSLTLF